MPTRSGSTAPRTKATHTSAPRTAPEPSPDQPVAPITGVATGSLGTASNLDDTQVFLMEDLDPDMRADGVPIDDPPPVESPPPAELPDQEPPPIRFPGDVPVDAPADAPPPMDAPRREPRPIDVAAVVAAPTRRRVRATSTERRRPFAWAGFAAVALIAVLVGAILGAAGNPPSGAGGENPAFGTTATPAPTTENDDGGGNGKGDGKGNGKGNDRNDD